MLQYRNLTPTWSRVILHTFAQVERLWVHAHIDFQALGE